MTLLYAQEKANTEGGKVRCCQLGLQVCWREISMLGLEVKQIDLAYTRLHRPVQTWASERGIICSPYQTDAGQFQTASVGVSQSGAERGRSVCSRFGLAEAQSPWWSVRISHYGGLDKSARLASPCLLAGYFSADSSLSGRGIPA